MTQSASQEKPEDHAKSSPGTQQGRLRFSLREAIGLVTISALAIALWNTSRQLADRESQLKVMRQEFGYLAPSKATEIAATRSPSDQPLSYRVRVRLPDPLPPGMQYQVVYSSLWESGETSPTWFAGVPVSAGESLVTMQVLNDPRDSRWKLAAVVSSSNGTKRMATVLPPPHEAVFRGSHDVISTGIGRETFVAEFGKSIRLLDERWLVDGAGLILDGGMPRETQVGIYAELQPLMPQASSGP